MFLRVYFDILLALQSSNITYSFTASDMQNRLFQCKCWVGFQNFTLVLFRYPLFFSGALLLMSWKILL